MAALRELFDEYMSECQYVRRLRPATLRTSMEAFKHLASLVPEIEGAEDLTHSLLTVFFRRLQTRHRVVGKGKVATGIRDSTMLSYASRLGTFFKWLKCRGHIGASPLEGIALPKPLFVDKRALTGEEIRRIMGAAAQIAPNAFLLKRDMAMIGVLTFCGLRRNELVSLEVQDVDLFSGFITVQPETSKSKRLRKVPINQHLKMYLREYLEERRRRGCKSSYLFVANARDKKLELPGIKHWVRRLSKASGIKFHVHRFRHTFATNLAMRDVGAIKIQKLMGHMDLKMTQTYLRSVSTEEMAEDVNKLSYEGLA
ncbi:MAG: site-specific integrase [Bacteroidetes bacterium]|nr:site-specific integrase [Bacteroidota bacterium]